MPNSRHHFALPLGAILAGLAVLLGAFGAHGLEGFVQDKYPGDITLQERRLDNWKTAAAYQMYSAVGLMILGSASGALRPKLAFAAAGALLLGTLLFSGCLYLLVLTGQNALGGIVPIGGVLQIAGWSLFAAAAWTKPSTR